MKLTGDTAAGKTELARRGVGQRLPARASASSAPPQHTARSLPAGQPGAAFPRPDLPGKDHQVGIAQQPGRRMVSAHVRMVSHTPSSDDCELINDIPSAADLVGILAAQRTVHRAARRITWSAGAAGSAG
jgi:hypothetical protein